jgi:hypothetical protein
MRYFSSRNILNISNTLRVVADCWSSAEESLRTDIKKDYPGVNEEFITQMFHGKLARSLREASEAHRIERAFLVDLQKAFPGLGYGSGLRSVAHGLIADVTLHRRDTERVTGGDIGFMIVRPQISDHVHDHVHTLQVGYYRRGLLCQAKIKRANGIWGSFTRQQKKVLLERLPYLALLLYSYEDEERRILRQFQWQLCNSASSINDVSQWLRRKNFPSLVGSNVIIKSVGNGQTGTDDDTTLDEIVAPTGNPALVIMINWPKDDYPGSQVRVYSRRKVENHVHVHVHH